MRSNKINYLVVGVFMLLILVGLVISIALLAGRTGATEKYFTVYENVTGLKYGTVVLYEGYPVGQVEKIIPEEKDGRIRFRVELSITKGWRIPADSVAQISASGLLAAVTIRIRAGASAEKIPPGQVIAGRESVNIFTSFSSLADQITELSENSIKPLLESLGRSVDSIGNVVESDGQLFVRQLRELVEQLTEQTPEIIGNLASFSAKLDDSGSRINTLFSKSNTASLNATIGNMESMSGNLLQISRDLHKTHDEFDQLLLSVRELVEANRPYLNQSSADLSHIMESLAEHIDVINHNLENTSRNLFEFSRAIRSNPGLLLRSPSPREEEHE